MRHLTTFLLVCAPLLLAAQHFAPFGARWTYTQGHVGGPELNLAVLEVIGDTVIAGRTCAKIEVLEGEFSCHAPVQYLAEGTDSTWYWDQAYGTYRLLFVWNAVPEQTWSTPVATGGAFVDTLDWTVVDTGHVLVDGISLRTLDVQTSSRQGTAYTPNARITERLGDAIAPFTWAHAACDAEIFLGLRCYSDPGINWMAPNVQGCQLPVYGTPFAPVGAQWTYQATSGQWPWTDNYWNHTVQAIADTLIDGNQCSVVVFPPSEFFPSIPGDSYWDHIKVYMTIRNDSILFRRQGDIGFQLLMDLNAEAGDSWSIVFPETEYQTTDTILYTVTGTNTIMYAGQALRQVEYEFTTTMTQFLHSYQTYKFTERFGGSDYFFPFYTTMVFDGMWITHLKCYSDPTFSWPDPDVDCATWLSVLEDSTPKVNVLPTVLPAGGHITVSTAAPGFVTIEVLDPLGRRTALYRSAEERFPLPMPTPGMWLVVVRQGDGPAFTQRVIVQ